MDLPELKSLDVVGKKVLLRADVDVGDELKEDDDLKLNTLLPTINYLVENEAKIIIVGHRGRPGKDRDLSLKEVAMRLSKLLGKEIKFIDQIVGEVVEKEIENLNDGRILMLENVRFDSREKENSDEFAEELASLGDCYVNEAFSASDKDFTSVSALPRKLPHAAGFHFMEEVEKIESVFVNPKKPVLIIMGGIKKDKLDYLDDFKKLADKVLVAGRFPEFLPEDYQNEKVVVAKLNQDREDITLHSIEMFEKEIKKAGTIIFAGPMGKYEDGGQRLGTKRVLEAIVNSSAFKIAGGGDTQQALAAFDCADKFDWVSVGGGATLKFLAKGTLPGIEALVN
ncbi:phosphoglycerate kinase [Patescibacteria group bacterium]|nr:phosphoglycerate kinase [Patescibacteria group bacterium]